MKEKLPLPGPARMLAGLLWAACIPVVIASVYYGLSYLNRREAFLKQKIEWETSESVYQSAISQQHRLEIKRGFFYELGAWSRIRLNWYDILQAIREQKPAGIHLLAVQSEGELDDVSAALSPREEIGRHFSLRMCCKSEPSVSSGQIVDFVRSLRNAHAFNKAWDDIRMGNISTDKHNPESGRRVMCLDGYGRKRRFVQQ